MLRRNVRKMREDETVNIKELLYPDKEEAKALKKETEDVVLSSVSETPEQRRNRLLSKAIWISNPGYLYPIPSLWQTTSQDYAWNEKEVKERVFDVERIGRSADRIHGGKRFASKDV